MRMLELESRLKREDALHKQRLEHEASLSAQEVEFISKLGERGVDLTKFLVAKMYGASSGSAGRVHLTTEEGSSAALAGVHIHTSSS